MTLLITAAVLAAILLPPTAVAARRLRRRIVARALADRVGIEMLPANSFDPRPEDIRRHAAALARVRPAAGGFAPLSTRAVSIRLTSQDGQMHYEMWGPRPAASVLRGRTYSAVELKLINPPADPETTAGIAGDEAGRLAPDPAALGVGHAEDVIPDLVTRITKMIPGPRAEPEP